MTRGMMSISENVIREDITPFCLCPRCLDGKQHNEDSLACFYSGTNRETHALRVELGAKRDDR